MSIFRKVEAVARKIPVIRRLIGLMDTYRRGTNVFVRRAPPGHYYSPIPDLDYVRQHREEIFQVERNHCPGIALNVEKQLSLLLEMEPFMKTFSFPLMQQQGFRYYAQNGFFGGGSAKVLYAIMRHFHPKRIIEVGSGFSSAAMLDVNERFLDGNIAFTFVEPYPGRLYSLLSGQDKSKVTIYTDIVQNLSREIFAELRENDILFIDSSHVAKINSDVVYLLTEILPLLQRGVIMHIHDIYWPFEYPEDWIIAGRAWNEAYLVKAFLQFNNCFEILLFNSYLGMRQQEFVKNHLPEFTSGGGSSLWLRKTCPPAVI